MTQLSYIEFSDFVYENKNIRSLLNTTGAVNNHMFSVHVTNDVLGQESQLCDIRIEDNYSELDSDTSKLLLLELKVGIYISYTNYLSRGIGDKELITFLSSLPEQVFLQLYIANSQKKIVEERAESIEVASVILPQLELVGKSIDPFTKLNFVIHEVETNHVYNRGKHNQFTATYSTERDIFTGEGLLDTITELSSLVMKKVFGSFHGIPYTVNKNVFMDTSSITIFINIPSKLAPKNTSYQAVEYEYGVIQKELNLSFDQFQTFIIGNVSDLKSETETLVQPSTNLLAD